MEYEIILLKSFIKNQDFRLTEKIGIFVGRTKESILIGPLVDEDFDFSFFHRRIISSCLYSRKTYKKISLKVAKKYVEGNKLYSEKMKDIIVEIFSNGRIIKHNLLFM